MLTIVWESSAPYWGFFKLYRDLSGINISEWRVGRVDNNRLNTEGLANELFVVNKLVMLEELIESLS